MRFKEYLLEEGEIWDAVRFGFQSYQRKRQEQKQKSVEKMIADKILSAEGKDLQQLVKRMVELGLTVQNGKVVKRPLVKTMSKEVLEHVLQSQGRRETKKDGT